MKPFRIPDGTNADEIRKAFQLIRPILDDLDERIERLRARRILLEDGYHLLREDGGYVLTEEFNV